MDLELLINVMLGAFWFCGLFASLVVFGVGVVYVAVVLPLRFLATYTITKIKGVGRKS